MRRLIAAGGIGLLLAAAAPLLAQTGRGGISGQAASYIQTTTIRAGSGTFVTPTGAKMLFICMSGGGGGGGAATSGGSTALGGGNGAQGMSACVGVLSPQASYSYSVGSGGAAGTCGATPTAAGSGGSTSFGAWVANGGGAGGTATTSSNGSGGGTSGSFSTFSDPALVYKQLQQGPAGANGNGDQQSYSQTGTGGSYGGLGATVNASGACHLAATAGAGGWIEVLAFMQ